MTCECYWPIFSPLVIEYMKKNHSEPDVVYEEGDVTALTYPNEAFDVVFDKGTEFLAIFWSRGGSYPIFYELPPDFSLNGHYRIFGSASAATSR